MLRLTDTFDEDCFEYGELILHVDMSFDNILFLFEMFDDTTFYENEKIPLALEMLIDEYDQIKDIPFDEKFALFKYVMNEFLEIDLDAEKEQEKKIMDFTKDAELIYASFFSVYHIDLFEMQGKLHWHKFNALLTNLNDESPFKQVVGYRTMKVPKSQEGDDEYRKHVIKMKQIHALEQSEEEQAANINKAFSELENVFKGVKRDV